MVETNAKERILEAGTAAIVAKSYNGCGLKEILDAAEVPKGSFYHYFKSKEDFGVAIIERASDEYATWTREILNDRKQSPIARLRTYFEQMVEHYMEAGPDRECLIAKLALEISQLSEPMRAAIKFAYDHWSGLLAKTLREAQAAGELSEHYDPDALADFLVNAWEGVTIRMQINRDVELLNSYMEMVFDRILKPCDK